MNPIAANIATCHRCPKRQRPVNGVSLCTLSGGNIVDHAARAQCPEQRFASSALATLTHGVAGIVKAVLHIDRADEATIIKRREICTACPESVPIVKGAGIISKCDKCKICGCVLAAKIVNAGEACPLGKWAAEAPQS
jgi:hypothetical protein